MLPTPSLSQTTPPPSIPLDSAPHVHAWLDSLFPPFNPASSKKAESKKRAGRVYTSPPSTKRLRRSSRLAATGLEPSQALKNDTAQDTDHFKLKSTASYRHRHNPTSYEPQKQPAARKTDFQTTSSQVTDVPHYISQPHPHTSTSLRRSARHLHPSHEGHSDRTLTSPRGPVVRRRKRFAQTPALGSKVFVNMSDFVAPLNQNAAVPATPPRSTAPTLSSLQPARTDTKTVSKSVTKVRLRLRGHRLFIGEEVLEKNHPEERKKIMDTLTSDAGTGLGEESARALKNALKKHDIDNEATFLDSVLPLMAPRTELNPMHEYVELKLAAAQKSVQVPVGFVADNIVCDSKEYEDDGIKGATNARFEDGFLPHLYADPILAQEMRKLDGMTNAIPDRILGYDNALFELPDELSSQEEYADSLLAVSKMMRFIFFLCEGKNNNGGQKGSRASGVQRRRFCGFCLQGLS
ncbi:uncharacterized protein KY384_000006 [Bacidia gigantensis]|uniref:uncharacterized protein n=1 Tax=Bacidia gigantensis TaxID=2732470 RepID=UPI001D0360EC|nr:uncharacterized protein KY384_000006 [Bacidia gigantensis]KAG8526413.1 hypothetical protein KY384_000006 [Bacidia gigantensis]